MQYDVREQIHPYAQIFFHYVERHRGGVAPGFRLQGAADEINRFGNFLGGALRGSLRQQTGRHSRDAGHPRGILDAAG